MRHVALSRRYARALAELAGSSSEAEKLAGELAAFAEAMTQSPELTEVISNPVFRAEREGVVVAVAGHLNLGELARRSLRYLIARGRLSILPAIAPSLTALLEESSGKVRAEVRAPKALSPDRVQRIRAALERITGRLVTVEQKLDPTILGGVVARVGSVVYDGSLRSRLAHFRSSQGKES